MGVIAWGKPRIFVQKEGESKWLEIPTPVENSVSVETTKGEKTEAKLEGGANEDVKYNANTYALSYQIRIAIGKTMPFVQNDGIVEGVWKVALQPENPNVPSGFIMEKSVVSAEDAFTTADGGIITYTHDALKPAQGNQIKWGVIKVTESEGVVSDVALEANLDE